MGRTQPAFFFGSADQDLLSATWKEISPLLSSRAVRGVITNPGELAKAGVGNLDQLKRHLEALCRWMSQVRPDGEGVVYVQQPNASMGSESVLRWARFLEELGDGKTRLGMKIPPFPEVLRLAVRLSCYVDVNVTGISDAATALRSLSYGVRYVSVMAGRMEEVGADARAHVQFIQQRKPDHSEVITGTVRTVEGLKWCCQLGTVPIIGAKVWQQIFNKMDTTQLPHFWETKEDQENLHFPPPSSEKLEGLSKAFFDQMDEIGSDIYAEFLRCGTSTPQSVREGQVAS